MADLFLDTNVLLRHVLDDHAEISPKARAIINAIEQGRITAHTSDIVIFETVFVLDRTYKVGKQEIGGFILTLLEFPGIVLPGKELYRRVFELYLSTGVGFADCYHAALMERLGLSEVLTFDRDFDKFPGITRREE